MDSFKILLVMIFQTVGVLSTLNCPLNETEWKVKSKAKVCQGSDVYHCLVVEDGKARTEKCKEKTLIMNGYCPIFTYDDYIHWKICNKTGCPNKHFPSDEVYKFPVCFNIESEGKDFLGRLESRQDNTLPLKIGIPVGIIAALVVAAIIVIVVMKKRRYTPTYLSCLWKKGETDVELPMLPRKQKPEYLAISIRQLKSKNTVYIIGQLGNSVSTAGKLITKKYAKRHKMKDNYYNYLDISERFSEICAEDVFNRKTVNFIDGWGGLWNDNPCEQRITLDTLEKVVKHGEACGDKKFVIGLRTSIREKLQEQLDGIGIRIGENERQSLDSITEYKIEAIEEKIRRLQSSCSDNDCGCKSLDYETVSGINQVPIGAYLVVQLMSIDHRMIQDFLDDNVGPLQAVQRHFEGLIEGDQTWPWLPYFVCMGYHDETEFCQDIADAFGISKSMLANCENIIKYTKTVEKLAPMWSNRFNLVKSSYKRPQNVLVFWHNFLYICAFHACYKRYPKEIMRFCNLDAILQLVRPKNHTDPFTIQAHDEDIDFFCEERLKNLADDSLCSEHPLIKDCTNRKENLL